jgi:hypothetical protein
VDEFWVCAHCRSLNRAGTGKCYSCKEKYGSQPKVVPGTLKPGGAPPPPPPPPPPPAMIPDFSGSATPAPYFSRPVALASVSRPGAAAIAAKPRRSLNPVTAIRRRIATSLAMRPSVSVGLLGYLTAILIVLVLAVAALIGMTLLPAAADLLQRGDVGHAWAQLTTGQQGLLRTLSIAFVAVSAVALLCFSVFIGLTTHNATGLGAEQPLLAPYQAGMCWVDVIWAQVRIVVGLAVPAALLWRGYEVPGLIAALVAVEIAHRHLDAGSDWLSRPYRHLPDLYVKLGMEGSISSPMAWMWSGCFRIANAMIVAVAAIPLMAFVLFVAAAVTGREAILGWQSTGLGAGQITVALLVSCLVGWMAISVALLVPITFGLVRRQRTRKTLVRVGRARSWVARPGEGGYGPAGAQAQGQAGGYDEDRIVERVASFGAGQPATPDPGSRGNSMFGGQRAGGPNPGEPGFGGPAVGEPRIDDPRFGGLGRGAPSGPGFGGPGLGGPLIGEPRIDDPRFGGLNRGAPSGPGVPGGPTGPGLGGPGFGGPSQGGSGQASLYSPSTTSSPFPWSEDPPVDPD